MTNNIESEIPDLAPQSPAAAFERFVELVRVSPAAFDADPDKLLSFLRPFLANPNRDEAHVRQIVEAFAASRLVRAMRNLPIVKSALWIAERAGRLRGSIEQKAPLFIKNLSDLEARLKTELRPGSIKLHLKPVRYLDTPSGFGFGTYHRYRIQVQTLIESTPDDELQAVTVELAVNVGTLAAEVDEMLPQPGFSTVGLKESAGLLENRQKTSSQNEKIGVYISAVGQKVSGGAEALSVEQSSTSVTVGGEKTVSRIEQYLFARKIRNRAIWRALAGIGPIDAAGAEYTADILVPAECVQMDVSVDARVDWLIAGTVPAILQRTITLPRSSESRLVLSATDSKSGRPRAT